MGRDTAVGPLLELLKDQNVEKSAAIALGMLGRGEGLELLQELLKDPYHDLLAATITAVRRLGSEVTASGLINVLISGSDEDVVASAVAALGELGSGGWAGPLIDLLKNNNLAQRRNSAMALGKLGNAEAVGPLIERLKDNESIVRSRAAEALGRLAREEAIGPLLRLMKDSNLDVQSSVMLALARLSAHHAVDSLKIVFTNDSPSRLAAAAALLCLNEEEGLGYLQKKTKTASASERKQIATILGEAYSERGNVFTHRDA